LLKPRSFDVYKNTTAPIIVMLDYLEIDMKVSDTDMETADSNNCKEVLENDEDANGVLAIMCERARFSYKNE